MAIDTAPQTGRQWPFRRRARERFAHALARVRLARDLLLARGSTHRYGEDRSQRAELYLPTGAGPHALVVLIHGGSWSKRYSKIVMRALARDLRRRGLAVWNIEYRRIGNGGGWPNTFADVGAAIDHVRSLDAPLDVSRVSVVGHSAGGHLALWAAARSMLAPGAPGAPKEGEHVHIGHAVALAGVCDLAGAYRRWRGGAVKALMGGSPRELPERFAIGDPMSLLPSPARVLLVHGVLDETVSVELSRSYAGAARAAGADVELIEIGGEAGGHRVHVDPRAGAWAAVVEWLESDAARAPVRAEASAHARAAAR
jgi:acetyl esterase/lipase